jgi:lipopolysaccharide heptosyltransferase II
MNDPRPRRRRYEIALWIDRRIGPVLCAALLAVKRLSGHRGELPAPEEVRKILLLKMWGMGSIVLASPLLGRLRARYPNARIDFVTLLENAPIVRMYPEVERLITIDLGGGTLRFLLATLRTLRSIRREGYDLLLDLEFFTRFSAIFSFLAGPRWSHGFSAKGNWRGKLHDVEVPFNAYHHVASNFLTVLEGDYMNPVEAEELARPGLLPRLSPPLGSWESCRRRLSQHPAWREQEPIVVVNPNAGDMALERRWPTRHVTDFLAELAARCSANLVLIGSPAEREYVESLVARSGLGSRVISLAGETAMAELVALFSHAAVVVTNDSGPMHVAAAAGASTVALFGPETPALYSPLRSARGQRHLVHHRKLACSPCMFVHDNKVLSCWFAQAKCMAGIEPAEVVASVEALLAEGAAGTAELRAVDS